MKKFVFLIFLILTSAQAAFCAAVLEQPAATYRIVHATAADEQGLRDLYRAVAAQPGQLARTLDEITDAYVHDMLTSALDKGIIFVAKYNDKVVGSFLKYRSGLQAFSHVLANGSILVHPDFQGKGIGSKLIDTLLAYVKESMPDILRVDLVVRESNRAKALYESKGFVAEGRFDRKIRAKNGQLEADIPMTWFNPNFKG